MAKPYKRKTIPIEDLKSMVNQYKLKKQAVGLYGNVYSYPDYGNYRNRVYLNQDTELGLDMMSRDLLVRWSREVNSQMGFVNAAVRILAQFAVGDAYEPEYLGKNKEWGKYAVDWLLNDFYPNCCTRGPSFDLKTVLSLESTLLDIDGDFLCIYGYSKNGFPKFQLIPAHRITTFTTNNSVYNLNGVDCVDADGVVYEAETGRPLGYKVLNHSNLVNTVGSGVIGEKFISTRDAQLIYDVRYADKGRGIPSIGPAILQALSIQEIDRYLLQRVKVESCVALIEKNAAGQAPIELEQTLQALTAENTSFGLLTPSPNVHAVDIFQGNEMRYIKSTDGSDIKSLASNTPAEQTQEYVRRLETQILATLGVPHQLIYSPENVAGRISDGIVGNFNAAIQRRQSVLDKHSKFIISWALANAMKLGLIPTNNDENIGKVFNLTHPPAASLNAGYDNAADLAAYSAGLKSMNDIVKKQKHTAADVMAEREEEAIEFFTSAKRISEKTGIELPTVIQSLREDLQAKPVTNAATRAPFNETK
jgi:hypothetical protein